MSRRRSPTSETLTIPKLFQTRVDRVLGRSVSCAVDHSRASSTLAFAAGSGIVLRDFDVGRSMVPDRYIQLPRPNTLASSPGTKSDLGMCSSPGYRPHRKSLTSPINGCESPISDPIKSRFRSQSLASVAISDDGKWLACGEQGHAPRILIWDLYHECDAPEPLHVIKSHSYGIKHLSFSPDSRYLASVGFIHDGAINVWDLQHAPVKVATNRVTARLQGLTWIGRKVLTIGVRHVRIWHFKATAAGQRILQRAVEETAALLEGRNLILGDHVHSSFISTCVVDASLFLAATRHAICVADVTCGKALSELLSVPFEITCMELSDNQLLVGDKTGVLHRYKVVRTDLDPKSNAFHKGSPDLRLEHVSSERCLGVGIASCHSSSSNQQAVVLCDGTLHLLSPPGMLQATFVCSTKPVACETDELGGLVVVQSHGELSSINSQNIQQSRSTLCGKDLSAAAFIGTDRLVYGTEDGHVTLGFTHESNASSELLGHQGEVLKIIVGSDRSQIASIGRDRMLQLYTIQLISTEDAQLHLNQTFAEHSSNINDALFLTDGVLVSCSADRTVVVRTKVESAEALDLIYAVHKVLTLKSAAIGIARISDNEVIVSCLDKSLLVLNVMLGDIRNLCKCEESYDLLAANSSLGVFCCASSQDRSISLRSLSTGQLVSSKGYGHVENLTGLQWSPHREDVAITTSSDGLVISWWFEFAEAEAPVATPVRKVMPRNLDSPSTHALGANRPGLVRRSSSLPRLGPTTPRNSSPTKMTINRAEKISRRPKSSHTETTNCKRVSDPGALSRTVVAYLGTLKTMRDQLSEAQLQELIDATRWL